jgi:TPP-dependent pyruvate/acetoin dehydrogenase alpha subunit
LEEYVLTHEIATDQDLVVIREDVRGVIDEAVAFARESPEPDPQSARVGVFA